MGLLLKIIIGSRSAFGRVQVKVAEHIVTGHKVAIKILNRRKIKQMDMEEKGIHHVLHHTTERYYMLHFASLPCPADSSHCLMVIAAMAATIDRAVAAELWH